MLSTSPTSVHKAPPTQRTNSTLTLNKRLASARPKSNIKRVDGHDSRPKKPKYGSLLINNQVVPITRRTRYVRVLEHLSMELTAVKQQLELTQQRLAFHEPHSCTETDTSTTDSDDAGPSHQRFDGLDDTNARINTRADTYSNTSPASHVSFSSLLPLTRHVMLMSQAQKSLHDATYVHAPVLLWKMNLRQRVLDANIAFCEMNGWSPDELIGRLIPPGNPAKPMLPPQVRFPEGNDLAPLKNGLPVGLTAPDLLPSRELHQGIGQLLSQKARTVTFDQRYVNAKAQLCQSRVTLWVVYQDGGSSSPLLALPSSPSSSSSSASASASCSSSSCSSSLERPECQSLLASYYSSVYPPSAPPAQNPYLQQIFEWLTPAVVKCFANLQEDVGDAFAATFECSKPLYFMAMACPSDTVVLRYPVSSHPYHSIREFHEEFPHFDMSSRWSSPSASPSASQVSVGL